jgi:hypothetical protein
VSTSSTYGGNGFPASAIINGDRRGANWGAGGGWADGTLDVLPDWVQVNFNGPKTISEVDLFTLQDTVASPSEPTPTMEFRAYGVTGWSVQYFNGTQWVAVPGATVSGNRLVWRQFTFSPITTTAIRAVITSALDRYSYVIELEAYTAAP